MPITAGNFKSLVQQGAYDGTIFHRVIEDFMIQGGEIDSAIPTIQDEFSIDNQNYRGTIAMAKTALPNSATSQFFINVVDNSNRYASFDSTYSVFGKVIEGMDVVDAISRLATDENDRPLQDVTLVKAELLS
jgi:peptidylprolyl isomerase